MKQKFFDCHCHIKNGADLKLYQSKKYICSCINIRTLNEKTPSLPLAAFNYVDVLVEEKTFNMYYCDSVNLDNNLTEEFSRIEQDMKLTKRIVGIKVYPGYQHYYLDDPKMIKVVEFCEKHGLTFVTHGGDVWPCGEGKTYNKYSNCSKIDDLAVDYPNVNFVLSHLNFPNIPTAFSIAAKNKNVFTDFSGIMDGATPRERRLLIREVSREIWHWFNMYPNIVDKLMFGTDFFASDPKFVHTEVYKKLVYKTFTRAERRKICWENVFEAYPKIK